MQPSLSNLEQANANLPRAPCSTATCGSGKAVAKEAWPNTDRSTQEARWGPEHAAIPTLIIRATDQVVD